MDARLQVYNDKMVKAVEHLAFDFSTIRAGRANPHVLDKIRVDYYGTPTPIQQVGNVTVPEPRMIQIAPWEKSLIKEIEKAIMTSDVGITPSNDGSVIRLVFPELTEERRKDLVLYVVGLPVLRPDPTKADSSAVRSAAGYFSSLDTPVLFDT